MLPLELWSKICSFSCTDGGYTGRALSLVSRGINAASEPYKLRILNVRGEIQIANLVRCLEVLPPHKRIVEHLYVTTVYQKVFSSTENLVDLYRPGICDRTPGPEPHEIIEDEQELLSHAISRLLTAVSPTVRSVHLRLDMGRDFIFFPVTFECLEEMTLQGNFESSFKEYVSHLPVNPTLRRLRIEPCAVYSDTTLFTSIAAYTPNLTHLYLQLSNPCHQALIPPLQALLAQASSQNHLQRFPQTLQRLILHPGRKEILGFCGTGYAGVAFAKRALYQLACSDPRVVLLKHITPISSPDESDEQTQENRERNVFEEWLDRVHGDLGCWDESDKATNEGF